MSTINNSFRNFKTFFLLILLTSFLLPSAPYAAEMESYCLIPPYVARQGIPPNVMLVYEKGSDIPKRANSTSYNSAEDYYGFFTPNAYYTFTVDGNKSFAPNYFVASSTCSPATDKKCIKGSILNWALMSSLDLSRKAFVGFAWPKPTVSQGAGDVYTYSGCFMNGSSAATCQACPDTNNPPAGCQKPISYGQYEDGNNDATVTVSVDTDGDATNDYTYSFCMSKGSPESTVTVNGQAGLAAPSCPNPNTPAKCSTSGTCLGAGMVAMKFTDESRLGLLQQFADKNQDYVYDSDAPRFGIRRWKTSTSSDERDRDILCDVNGGNCTSTSKTTLLKEVLNAVSKEPAIDPDTSYLGAMMKDIFKYFNGVSATYEDKDDAYTQTPYSWATDPLKACRKTFAFYITTGTYLGENTDKLSPLPAACTSLKYDDDTTVTEAFPINTCYAYNTDLYTADGTPPRQNITTYVVHTTFYGAGAGNEDKLRYAANISDGEYFRVDKPEDFENEIENALNDMLKRAASGTAASVLASGEGSGANLVQAVFYPKTPKIPLGLFDTRISWIGRLSNYWYFIDPRFTTSTILEDTTSDNILNLSDDKTVRLKYDATNEYAVGYCYNYSTGASANCAQGSTPVRLEFLRSLWDAGVTLWSRDISVAANKRKIYTTTNGTGFLTGNFSRDTNNGDSDNSAALRPYFDLPATDNDGNGFKDGDLDHDGNVNDTDASILIRYLHGEDFPSYAWLRSRTTAVDLNGDGDTADTVNGISESAKVWKLGDVLNSTPRMSSWIKLNSYDDPKVYNDTTYASYVASSTYASRGMVFSGANDGMLHAFKLGLLGTWPPSDPPLASLGKTCSITTNKACRSTSDCPAGETCNAASTDLGKEVWAFIPKNVLPYLRYLTDTDYCHVYSVDLTPYIFDASINGNPDDDRTVNSWKTILIGGMRLGGACKYSTSACSGGGSDCVKSPVSNSGLSSYFAIDITDQNNPTLLWEFSNEDLGYTTTGPAVVRIGVKDPVTGLHQTNKNGKWFVVFGSGPTGPISTSDQQFLGRSDQNLRLFIIDLKTGAVVRTVNTGISNAFAGLMNNATLDTELNYQDDVLYVPYVRKDVAAGTWSQGGVLRLSTKEDIDPSQWSLSTVIDGIGPVTSSVVKLQNKRQGKLWLYVGTGRYYFEQADAVDDGASQRMLIGMKDPCYTSSVFNGNCTTSMTFNDSNFSNVTSDPSADPSTILSGGWYINLDLSGSYTYLEGASNITRNYRAERVITDPLSTTTGLVFFTTFKPYNDVCAYGGKTFIWAVKYDTGGAAGALLQGVALIQVSTGAIEQIDLSGAFTDAGGRKTGAMEGVPPAQQGLSILTPPPAVKRTIHIRER